MIIRKAIILDKAQLLVLFQKFYEYLNGLFSAEFLLFTKYKDKEKTFSEVLELWLNNLEYTVFVAEENNQLIGYVCGTVKNKPLRVLDKEGSIVEWFVEEQWRGKGIGKKLYEELFEDFKKAKCTHLGLRVYTANNSAINLYRKNGFIENESSFVKIIY